MTTFTTSQLNALRNEYAKINTVTTDRLDDFRAMFAKCSDEMLKQLALAGIKFVSKLAVNACVRRGVQVLA